LTRYTKVGIRIPFFVNFGLVVITVLMVATAGLILDARKRRSMKK
jgi:hypothetical protein